MFYTGYTSHLSKRLKKHNANHAGFTGRANDWIIMYHETFVNKTEALKRERQIKGFKNRERIEKLIHSKSENNEIASNLQ